MKFSRLFIIVWLFLFTISFAQARSYDLGYSHGCSTAKGHWKRNYNLYKHNYRYKRGWRAGKRYCKPHYTKKHHYSKKKQYQYNRESYDIRSYKRGNYNLGYKDGCRTARYRYTKNRYKFRNIRSYREGWRTGRRDCYE
ncbi:hypothetical protein MNB_SV-15-814 [hydrothermal vent metagenome]|uniref:Uncharacterized protein n=1 Tax=hydrothermal vent metagenome TaxID=652676 RepID=A0A1W1EJP9_9ZZZZ